MNRAPFWIIAAILAFFLAGILAVVWSISNLSQLSYDEAISKGVPSVEYCDLRDKPDEYNGKVVRVSVNLYWFLHGFYLQDDKCSDIGVGKGIDEERTAISAYEPNREKIFANLIKMRRLNDPMKPSRITVVGRFQHKSPEGFSDSIEDRTSFHFEIYKIESAER